MTRQKSFLFVPKAAPESFDVASSILSAFQKRDSRKLRKLNDDLVKEAVIHFTKVMYEYAVLSYVLSKILSKPRFLTPQYAHTIDNISRRLNALSRSRDADERTALIRIKEVKSAIHDLERRDERFVLDLMTKGNLKVAATLYAKGVSLGTASEMTGINKQEILDYAGKTMMFDRIKEEKTLEDRMKIVRRLTEVSA